MAVKEAWNEDTGKDVVKAAAKGVVACGAVAVIGLTFGAVGATFN